MSISASEEWSVEVVESGRSGSIGYREAAGFISFYWEFGGGDTVAIIWIEDLAVWSTRHPWAVERRREILERVAREVVRQRAPTCRADIDEQSGYIYIRENAA
jgi:predicted RNA-binding protein with TRAM domain